MSKKVLLAVTLTMVLITAGGGFPWLLERAMWMFTGCPDHLLICDEPD